MAKRQRPLAEVDLAQAERPAYRAEPFHEVLGLAPRLEQKTRGSVIDAGDDKLAIGVRLICVCRQDILSNKCAIKGGQFVQIARTLESGGCSSGSCIALEDGT